AEQSALADAVRGLARAENLRAQARSLADGDDDALPAGWDAVAKQELLALPFDTGLGYVCVALDAFGESLAPGAIVPTLLVGTLVATYGAEPLREQVAEALRA